MRDRRRAAEDPGCGRSAGRTPPRPARGEAERAIRPTRRRRARPRTRRWRTSRPVAPGRASPASARPRSTARARATHGLAERVRRSAFRPGGRAVPAAAPGRGASDFPSWISRGEADRESAHMKVVGLDACRATWLGVALEDGRFAEACHGAAADLVGAWPDAEVIGVDIPIGLPSASPGRDADLMAREFVGERRSSVFATFPAVVLETATYPGAKEIC